MTMFRGIQSINTKRLLLSLSILCEYSFILYIYPNMHGAKNLQQQWFTLKAILHEVGGLAIPNRRMTFLGIESGLKGNLKNHSYISRDE